MTRDKKDVERDLLKKGFRKKESGHRYFIYYTMRNRFGKLRTT